MKRILPFALLIIAVVATPAGAQQMVFDPLAVAENSFATDLYGKLSRTPGNFFFSPYSVATALDMIYVGAKGTTADEIARVLHLELLDGVNAQTDLRAALLADAKVHPLSSYAVTDGLQFEAANALWGDQGYAFNPQFVSDIAASFGGALNRVDFKQPEQSSLRINNWVNQQTKGKIQNLISADMLRADPALVLTDAVYFKAAWAEEFDASATKPAKFHVAPGRDVMAEMMNDSDSFALTQADGVKVLSIVYRGFDTAMVIILPDDRRGLPAVEATLSAERLNGWLENGRAIPVILSLPKFHIDSQFQLGTVLQALGVRAAFDSGRANFTGIAANPARPIYIGAVVHKAYIEIDEKGTEAAAATAVAMAVAAAAPSVGPPPPPPVRFNADHPFIYLIRSTQTGEVLFMGRVDDPTNAND